MLLWSLVLLYIAGLMVLGAVLSRRIRGVEDFLVAGRRANRWMISLSILATWVGVGTFVGGTGGAYDLGISFYWIHFSYLGATAWLGLYISPKVRRTGVLTVPQLIDRLFGARHKLVTVILVFIGDMGAIAGTILASVILISFFLGIGFVPALMMVLGVTIVYVLLGGQWAVLWTDSIQAVMLTATGISIFVIGVTKLGGWTGFTGRLPAEMVSFTGTLEFGTMAGWVVEGIVIAMVYHALFVRGLSARSTREAQLGFLYGGILCTFFYILPHALGLLGRASFGVGTEPNHVFFRLMSEGLPVLLVSFVLAGAIAGAMSTLDSALMSVASYLTIDLYQRHIKPAATQGQMVTAARVAVAGSAILGGLVAYALPMTLEVFLVGQRVLGSALAPVLVGLIFHRPLRRMPTTVLSAMVIGAGVTILFTWLGQQSAGEIKGIAYVWHWHPCIPGTAATVLALLVGARMERPPAQPGKPPEIARSRENAGR